MATQALSPETESITGTLDERTVHSELSVTSLDSVRSAYRQMVYDHLGRLDSERGTVQVFYPGPVLQYRRLNGNYSVRIFANNGSREQADRLRTYIFRHEHMHEP